MMIFGPMNPPPATGGASILEPGGFRGGEPVGGPESIFNIHGAPIAILGGVFGDGFPLGGPVGQIFRSTGPQPNTLFIATLSSSGPIGNFLTGAGGAEIQFGPSLLFLALPEAIGFFAIGGQPIFGGTPVEVPSTLETF